MSLAMATVSPLFIGQVAFEILRGELDKPLVANVRPLQARLDAAVNLSGLVMPRKSICSGAATIVFSAAFGCTF